MYEGLLDFGPFSDPSDNGRSVAIALCNPEWNKMRRIGRVLGEEITARFFAKPRSSDPHFSRLRRVRPWSWNF